MKKAMHNASPARIVGTLLVLAVICGSAGSVHATDQSKYERHVAKFATRPGTLDVNPRFMCVCQEPPDNRFRVGYMFMLAPLAGHNATGVLCYLPRFDANGTRLSPQLADLCDSYLPMRR